MQLSSFRTRLQVVTLLKLRDKLEAVTASVVTTLAIAEFVGMCYAML